MKQLNEVLYLVTPINQSVWGWKKSLLSVESCYSFKGCLFILSGLKLEPSSLCQELIFIDPHRLTCTLADF